MHTTKLGRGFLNTTSAAIGFLSGALASSLASSAAAHKISNQTGPGEKRTKHLSRGPAEVLVRTRQIERAEGREYMKKMNTRMMKRVKDAAAKSLVDRVTQREMREVARRDNRMTVHDMIEHSKGADRFNRSRFV